MTVRLSKPRQTAAGWTIRVRSAAGRRATLGPFSTELDALAAQCDWHTQRCWEANLRTIHAVDQAEGAVQTGVSHE